MTNNNTLLDVHNLKMYFPITQGIIIQRHVGDIKAVDGITFSIKQGETMGLVGESGCGKSTTGRAILQLYRPTDGHVLFKGEDLTQLKGESLRRKRRQMQMIFQDPYASLNPRMTVGNIIGEPLEVHNTPAHWCGASVGGEPGVYRLRRTDFGTGRVHPGPDHQPAGRSTRRVWLDVPLYRPRPECGAAHQ
jgi:ABC-type glutathione transport system ATPase component